jgi:hypothetical protein
LNDKPKAADAPRIWYNVRMKLATKRSTSIVAGMIFVLTIFVLMVFPIFYTPTCRISEQSFGVRKARTVARLYNIAFACVEFRVPNFERRVQN